jgi:ABC-type multidrug transport system fused ATPase/permease subunit
MNSTYKGNWKFTNIYILKRTLMYLKPFKFRFIFALILMILSLVLKVIQPLMFGIIIDNISKHRIDLIIKNIIVMTLIFVGSLTLDISQNYLLISISNNIEINVKANLFNSILKLNIETFEGLKKGEFITKLNNDVQAFSNVLTQKLTIFIDVFSVIVIGIIIFKLDWVLSLILLGIFPLSVFIFIWYGKKIKVRETSIKNKLDTYNSFLYESLNLFKLIKIFNIEKIQHKKFTKIIEELYFGIMKKFTLNISASTLSQIINFISYIILILVGSYHIVLGKLTLGGLVSFNNYSINFTGSLFKVSQINSEIQEILVSLRRVIELIDTYNSNNDNNNKIKNYNMPDNIFHNDIIIRNLNFKYPNSSSYILKNINLNIPANRLIAVVGLSGAGKSTLFNVLTKTYKNYEGEIFIGNTNYDEITDKVFLQNTTFVTQENFFFSMTIKENLLLANPNASEEEIIESCKLCNIHDYIYTLPNKYDTTIGYNGINLSVGQQQRLSIARALLRKCSIYFFDEITSALDSESENQIKDLIKKISANHTVIIISHKLNTIKNADFIILVKDGEVVYQGENSIGLKSNSYYLDIFNSYVSLINV